MAQLQKLATLLICISVSASINSEIYAKFKSRLKAVKTTTASSNTTKASITSSVPHTIDSKHISAPGKEQKRITVPGLGLKITSPSDVEPSPSEAIPTSTIEADETDEDFFSLTQEPTGYEKSSKLWFLRKKPMWNQWNQNVDCRFIGSSCGWNSVPWEFRWKLISMNGNGKYNFLRAPLEYTAELRSPKIAKANHKRCLSFQYEAGNSGLVPTSSELNVTLETVDGVIKSLFTSTNPKLSNEHRVDINILCKKDFHISFYGYSDSYSFTTKLFYIKFSNKACGFEGTSEPIDFLQKKNPPMRWQASFWNPPTPSYPPDLFE